MRAYIIKRLLLMIPTLFGITLISFSIIRLAPGDPAVLKARAGSEGISDQAMAKKIVEQTQRIYGLDKPIMLNFRLWTVQKNIAKLKSLDGSGEVPFDEIGLSDDDSTYVWYNGLNIAGSGRYVKVRISDRWPAGQG